MTIFASKEKKASGPDAKEFMSKAREEHMQLFSHYAERADEDYDDVSDLISDMETDSWTLAEKVVKASYANGIRKGRSLGRRSSQNR